MAIGLEETKIAARYARALFDGAVESGDEDNVLTDLQSVRSVIEKVPELIPFWSNPAVPVAEKLDVVSKQFTKLEPLVVNLLRLMIENDRAGAILATIDRYEELSNARAKVTTAEVVTAVELNKKLQTKLQKQLESLFSLNKVVLTQRVDPGILGGAIIKIQDKVIDGSYIGKLEALRKQIS
jgi:F-type H+-transporting ATPase subunit delta